MHKINWNANADMLGTVAFADLMLDTGCSMLVEDPVSSGDNLHTITSDIYKHPVSRNQDPGSANDSRVFRRNRIGLMSYLMQLRGIHCHGLDGRDCLRPVSER